MPHRTHAWRPVLAAVLTVGFGLATATCLTALESPSDAPAGASSPESLEPASPVRLADLFDGTWRMRGRFRHAPDVEWIPTGSTLSAQPKLDNRVVLREISAAQIGFSALDLITYNPETEVAQYIYVNNGSPSALIFEGTCREGCRVMELEQVCGPAWPYPGCAGRTTITFESDDRFVARDYRPAPGGEEFMSREVVYSRSDD